MKPLLSTACAILLLLTSSGCTLNSFQANIRLELRTSDSADLTKELAGNKIVILVHGLYGDADTFGDLSSILLQDRVFQIKSVYTAQYWSSRILPNFRRLADFGESLKNQLETIASENPTAELIVIAHSQGGLIARYAILSMKDNQKVDVLGRMKLIMIGTPNFPSLYATYNNLIVNAISGPVAYVSGLFTMGTVSPPIYNRQAYDMASPGFLPGARSAEMGEDLRHISPFMENMILRWGRAFPMGSNDNPKIYAIIGVKNLVGHYDLSDGVVHSLTTLSAGIPHQRVYYVPYRHFGALTLIENDRHQSYKAIKAILLDDKELASNAQQLSPFSTFAISQALLVAQDGYREREPHIDRVRWFSQSPILETTNPSEVVRTTLAQSRSPDLFSSFGLLIFMLSTFPIALLQTFNQVPAFAYDSIHSPSPAWNLLRGDTFIELIDEEAYGTIEVTGVEEGEKSWWRTNKKAGNANFSITANSGSTASQCRIEVPVNWGDTKTSTDGPRVISANSKLPIVQNSINFIKADIIKSESTQQDMIVLSTGSCIDP